MTIAHVATGTAVGTTNNPSPSVSGTASAGELLVAPVTGRFSSAAAPSRSGWQLATPSNNPGGSGTDAADTGTTDCWFLVKHAVAETGAQTITTSGDCHQALIQRFSKASGKWWSLEGTGGGDTTVDTSFSATGSAIGLAANDMLLSCAVAPSDTPTWSSKLLAAAGITFGTQVADVADFATTSGSDQRAGILRAPVNSGSGNVAPTYSHTASGSGGGSGSAAFLRLREIDAPTFKAEIAPQPGTTSCGMVMSGLGAAIDDLAVITVASKPASTGAPATPTDWVGPDTHGGTFVVGTGADGTDTGQVRISFYYRILNTASPADAIFTPPSPGTNVMQGNGMLWSKPAGTNWKTPVFTVGDDTTSGTSYSATGSNLNGQPGDHYYLCSYMTRGSNIASARSSVVPGAILDYFGVSSSFTANGNHLAFWLDRGQGMAPQTGGATQSATYAAAQSGGSAQALVGLSTSQSATVSQSAETSTATALTEKKTKAIAQASGTDTASAVTARKTKAVAQAIESDTATAVTFPRVRAVNRATATDTATAATERKLKAVSQALEAATASSTGERKTKPLTQASSTDTAVAVGERKTKAAAAAAATDTATAITGRKLKTLGQAIDTSSASPMTQAAGVVLGQAVETDTATTAARRKTKPVAQAGDSSTATAAGEAKRRTVPQAAESASATALVEAKGRPVATATGTGAATSIGQQKARILGPAAETDTARDIVRPGQVIRAIEADAAQALLERKTKTVGSAAGTDTAGALTPRKARMVGQAVTTDTATDPARAKRQLLDRAAETSTSTVTALGKTRRILQAAETSLVRPVTGAGWLLIVEQATETSVAYAIVPRRTTRRPNTGTTSRPSSGTTPRPFTGVTPRP